MTDYTQFKVSELKDILRQRNLSLGGTKSELINRLQEHDAGTDAAANAAEEPAEPTPAEEPPKPEEKAVPEPSAAAAAETTEAAGAAKAVEGESAAEKTEAPAPQLTDDEFLAKVKEDLEHQIQRAKRFGVDTTELEARQKRILKFGIGAVRDAAAKANTSLEKKGRKFNRRKGKKFRQGPKPATA